MADMTLQQIGEIYRGLAVLPLLEYEASRQEAADILDVDLELVEAAVDRLREHVGPMQYRRVAEIKAEPIRWLWQGRIARGKVTMIAGDPGLGKSQITASMAAIVSRGGRWPVDRTSAERGPVIILSAEDDPSDTIRPRLEAAGADLSKCYFVDAVRDIDDHLRPFTLERDISNLGDMLARVPAALVVIDPVSAFLGRADSHVNSDIRALLYPLSQLAAKHETAIVCVSHLNKASGQNALSRFTGSLAFVAAARAAYVVAKDPNDETRRLFLPAKNNIGPDQSGLAFNIEPCEVNGIAVSRISWHPDPVTLTADQALAPAPVGRPDTERTEAMDWLRDSLAGGPVSASFIQGAARSAGIAAMTLRRAKDALCIESKRDGAGWVWMLPQGGHSEGGQYRSNNSEHVDQLHETRAITGFQGGQTPQDVQHVQYSMDGDDLTTLPKTCPKCAGEGCQWCEGTA